jgi:hypothetical protein
MAEDGKPGPRLRAYHEGKARGGCALTIIGGSSSVHPSSPASAWNMPANHDDSIIPAYRATAEAIHRHGCLAFTQLTHLGRRAQSDNESWHVLLAPSQIPERVHREIPHELEPEQIAMLVRAFGDAVRRCREGGLDGVELSFAHNHLVDQFWSPIFNQRADEYGGSLDNRMRFGYEVLREIRRQAAPTTWSAPHLRGRVHRRRSDRRGHGGDRAPPRRLGPRRLSPIIGGAAVRAPGGRRPQPCRTRTPCTSRWRRPSGGRAGDPDFPRRASSTVCTRTRSSPTGRWTWWA